MRGKAKMEMKALITFTCINLKKLMKMISNNTKDIFYYFHKINECIEILMKNQNLGFAFDF